MRKRKLTSGGQFHKYAMKMKNKERIDANEFKAFLAKAKNPLQTFIDYDGKGYAYTINEYALLHDAGNDIQSLFWQYEVNLGHLANYSALIGIQEPLTLLEAHIIYSKYGENIRCIIEQIQQDLPNRAQYLFRMKRGIPTVLYFALESSNYALDPLEKPIYDIIMQTYYGNNIYRYLTQNNSFNSIKELVTLGIRFCKPDFLSTVLLKVGNSENIVKLIFNDAAVSFLLLQNNKELFATVFNVLQRLDQDVVLRNVREHALTAYKNKDANQLFKIVGQQTLRDILSPYNDTKVRIIIRCHGIINKMDKQGFSFPFDRLCFFVNAGETLGETCIVSNRTEAMICNGNYDADAKCIKSVNNEIITEPMKFIFDAGFFAGKRNMFTGVYVCMHGCAFAHFKCRPFKVGIFECAK